MYSYTNDYQHYTTLHNTTQHHTTLKAVDLQQHVLGYKSSLARLHHFLQHEHVSLFQRRLQRYLWFYSNVFTQEILWFSHKLSAVMSYRKRIFQQVNDSRQLVMKSDSLENTAIKRMRHNEENVVKSMTDMCRVTLTSYWFADLLSVKICLETSPLSCVTPDNMFGLS